jgi:hypothetical protein
MIERSSGDPGWYMGGRARAKAVATIVGLGLAALAILTGLRLTAGSKPVTGPGVQVTPDRCEPAAFRPQYLPWVEEGEDLPPPELLQEGRNAILVWSQGETEALASSDLSLVTEFRPEFGSPEELEGAPGREWRFEGSTVT